MCGITGFFSYKNKVNTKKYYAAHKKIAHRGPDDEGFIYKNKYGHISHLIGDDTIDEFSAKELIHKQPTSSLILGHRRLSIIDLSSDGHQPFEFDNLYLTYNGEIYNYIELREELKELGYSFDTGTDTEVFLKAYHCWGVAAFNRFNGMWASAIYDSEKDELLLVRDRFGIKPLYYTSKDDSLVFGSEIKFVAPFFEKLAVNEEIIYAYLRFNYINHSAETFFQDIKQLEPNHYMIYSADGIKIEKYWDLKSEETISSKEIEAELTSSISLRMRSDVEVGSLLSGGIDSSLILGIINQNKLTKEFQSFSAVFSEKSFSEKEYIDEFQPENLKLKKHFIYPSAAQAMEHIDELIYIQEEPFRSLAVFSQYEIYKYIKSQTETTVLLNGQGADEIFGGYTEYYYHYFIELLSNFEFLLFLNEVKAFSRDKNMSYLKLFQNMTKSLLFSIISKNDKYGIFKKKYTFTREKGKFNSRLKNVLWSSLTFSALREYLRYEDRNSMAFSLESRLPFLDFRVVNSAFSLKNNQKINRGISKCTLREIAKGKIPDITLYRKDKMGFVSPQEIWQREVLKDDFDKVFFDIKENGLFDFLDSEKIFDIYTDYQNGKMKNWSFIWNIFCLYKWKEQWITKEVKC